jgi:L-ribulokinase
LNQVYASVFNKPILVPERPITSLGSAIFAFMAAKAFPTIADAQRALCPPYRVVRPDPAAVPVYERLFALYRKCYFGMGDPVASPTAIGDVLPTLRQIAAQARGAN